jgi:hypothetical protein
VLEHVVLDGDLAATEVSPRVAAGAVVERDRLRASLPARSWNVIRLAA